MKVTKFSGSHYLRSGLVSQMSTTSARVTSINSQKHLSVSQWASYWQYQSIIGQLKVTFLDGRHLVRSIKRLWVLTWTLYSNLALPATSSLCTWINKISFFLLIWVKANLFCFSQTVIQQLKVVQNSGDLGRSESKKNGQVLITSPMRACWGESVLSSPPLLKSQRPNQAQRVTKSASNFRDIWFSEPVLATARPLRPHVESCLSKLQRGRFAWIKNT